MTDTRLNAAGLEVLASPAADAVLNATSLEVLASPSSSAQLNAVSLEVLVPTVPPRFRWGVPINTTYG